LNLQLETAADVAQISAALSGEHVSIVGTTQEAPNNVNAAGQNEILISILPDAFNDRSLWLWAAFDNLRVAAATAVECAESMAAARPRGQIQ
jgi:aspartate-semialdehyde dehydrogenase